MSTNYWHQVVSSIAHHAGVDLFIIEAQVVSIDGADHTKLVIDVLKCGNPVPDVDATLQFFVDHVVALYPCVRLLIINVV